MLEIRPGLKIASRFEVKGCIGSGGFSVVWQATDLQLKRDVALKRFNLDVGDHARRIEDAIEEARKVAAISSPHVVQVYDVLRLPDEALVVMEFMAGGSLHDRLRGLSKNGKWMDVPGAFRIIRSVLHGLRATHEAPEAPIIHRDLKPQNLLFDRHGNVKIADFGLASVGATSAIETAHPGRWEHSGTPGYKSPEQLRGGELGPQTDLFNVGLISYLLFSATHPFVCPRLLFDYKEMVLEPYRELPSFSGPTLPGAVKELLNKLLAEKPGDRFQSASEALAELDAIEAEYDGLLLDRALEFYDALRGSGGTQPSIAPEELAKGIVLCKKKAFYIQGAFLYEKSGVDLHPVQPPLGTQVIEDYQFCRRRAGREVNPE